MTQDFGWAMGLWMLLFWVLVVAATVALLWFLVKKTDTSRTGGDTALEHLKKRYARGEIDREQYRQMRQDLEELTSPT